MPMHPVQAAPRQRAWFPPAFGKRFDAPRAGSAEAKYEAIRVIREMRDAPRAGSAEAKNAQSGGWSQYSRDAPRAGSAEAKKQDSTIIDGFRDAPRAGSAEAKKIRWNNTTEQEWMHPVQAAPRQRPAPCAH